MSKKQVILDAIDRGHLATALRLIAEGIEEGDNTAVQADADAAAAAAAAAQADADQANADNTTQQAELDNHEGRITTLETP